MSTALTELTEEAAPELVSLLTNEGSKALQGLTDEQLLQGWDETLERFRSRIGRQRDELAAACSLSVEGFERGLGVMMSGSSLRVAERLLSGARETPKQGASTGFAAVVLSATPPGLALQVLLPALVKRRPLVLKSSSNERTITQILVKSLHEALPETINASVHTSWRGGSSKIEDLILGKALRIVAYGRQSAIEPLRKRYGERVIAHGPMLSAAVVGRTADLASLTDRLALDIALFDQRGCLSLQWIFSDLELKGFAAAMEHSLRKLSQSLPMGPPGDILSSQIQAERAMALMQGHTASRGPLSEGTVIGHSLFSGAQTGEFLQPSPGGRTVRLFEVPQLEDACDLLLERAAIVQGVVLEGQAQSFSERLGRAGIHQISRAGKLQDVDAGWWNGGHDPLEIY